MHNLRLSSHVLLLPSFEISELSSLQAFLGHPKTKQQKQKSGAQLNPSYERTKSMADLLPN